MIDVGRIPAQNLYQAKVAFDKIIAYERCHNYTEGMFSKSLHCVQFEDETKAPTDSISDPEGIDSMFPNIIKGLNRDKIIPIEKPLERLGATFNRGLELMTQSSISNYDASITPFCRYQREIYHCFGDPSMKIRTNEQTKFENADIDMDYKTLTCRVKTGEGPAFISFYDANNGKIECVYSDEAEFTFSNVHSLGGVVTPGKQPPLIYKENVVISGPNKIPTIISSWARTGAIPDPVVPEIDPKFENVKLNGETLTVAHNCGDNDRVVIYIADVKTASEVMKVECDSGSQSIDIDFSGVPSGIYAIMLIVNDNVADTVKISK